MLCCVCCSTEPKAIKSLAGVARPREEYPSPKYDASATALRGTLETSVKILILYWDKALSPYSPYLLYVFEIVENHKRQFYLFILHAQ